MCVSVYRRNLSIRRRDWFRTSTSFETEKSKKRELPAETEIPIKFPVSTRNESDDDYMTIDKEEIILATTKTTKTIDGKMIKHQRNEK